MGDQRVRLKRLGKGRYQAPNGLTIERDPPGSLEAGWWFIYDPLGDSGGERYATLREAREVVMESGFYEDDEPVEKIEAIAARPPDGVTGEDR